MDTLSAHLGKKHLNEFVHHGHLDPDIRHDFRCVVVVVRLFP